MSEKAAQVRRLLGRLDGSAGAAVGDDFKILDARALFGKIKVELLEGGLEGDVTHLRAQHVKKHGAFVLYHGTVIRGIGSEAGRLRDGRGILIHQRANGEFVNGAESRFLAGILLGVERFGVASKTIADPDVARRCGQNLNAPPLRGHQTRNRAVAGSRIPDALAEEQNSRSRVFAE